MKDMQGQELDSLSLDGLIDLETKHTQVCYAPQQNGDIVVTANAKQIGIPAYSRSKITKANRGIQSAKLTVHETQARKRNA